MTNDPCVLCGSTDDTNEEDVYPPWARRLMTGLVHEAGLDASQLPSKLKMPMWTATNREAGKIEEVAADLLKPLVGGELKFAWSPQQQKTVALWACMKDVSFELVRKTVSRLSGTQPRSERELNDQRVRFRGLLDSRNLPAGYLLRMVGIRTDVSSTGYKVTMQQQASQAEYSPSGLSSVMPLGHVVFQSFWDSSHARVMRLADQLSSDDAFVQVWPPRATGGVRTTMGRLAFKEVQELRDAWSHAPDNQVGSSFVVGRRALSPDL